MNHYFGRPGIPIGVNKGPGFLRDSKYAEEIAAKWPRRLQSAAEAPDAVELYRSVLEKQPDRSVVMISIGQLTNLSNLLKTSGGADLVRRKVKLWVSMGAAFPSGREANIFHDAAAAQHAVANWPAKVVFSGYEIGVAVLTGGKLAALPQTSPVRRAYELYNGIQPHKSWDQTAVLYGVRCVDDDCGLWTLSGPGECEIDGEGRNTWRKDPNGRHKFLMARMAPRQVAGIIEEQMVAAAQPVAAARYQPTWESLKTHPDPAWFEDAKFGIYFHWGPYSVPAFGTEWYSRNMYRPDRIEHKHHLEKYGTLDKFGYKDFIPMFRAEHFDPDEWAALFAQSGARFAGPVAEHADGFSMWDSRLTKWNAARMGPKRDVVGEMARAIRKRNMKFLATFHHQWLWAWYPTFDPNVDASNPAYSGLYGPPVIEAAWNYRKDQLIPDEAFCKLWRDKVKEVIDRYEPDLLYFDSRLGNIAEPYRKDLLAYYYNRALGWKREVALTYKQEDLERGAGILDVERGRMASAMPFKWMVDDSIDWKSWSYIEDASLKSAGRIVGELVDVVSKNGNLLLDITPRADGVIPEPVQERLREIGAWLKLNGEAIYGTRPWKTFGEGPTEVKEGTFGEKNIKDLTADDIRFTTRGDLLYAIVLGWPERDISIRSLGIAVGLFSKKITTIQLIGSDEKLVWERGNESVVIRRPRHKPCEHAIVFRIETT